VLNDARGVLLEVEGSADAVDAFLARLAPRRRRWRVVERVSAEERASRPAKRGFAILESPRGVPRRAGGARQRDLRRVPGGAVRPRDRRFRYPFINCTNCGPRFTIVRGVPYDRPHDDGRLRMCERCQAEYEDPATGASTPSRTPARSAGRRCRCFDGGGDAVATGARTRRRRRGRRGAARGKIVAIKGIGGYHLACRADDEEPCARCARASTARTSRSR
jgi:hydrogenase maturation protein HypF